MIRHKFLELNYSELIDTQKYQIDLSQTIVSKTVKSTNRYSFIDFKQWMLLLFINSICLGFVTFACFWID